MHEAAIETFYIAKVKLFQPTSNSPNFIILYDKRIEENGCFENNFSPSIALHRYPPGYPNTICTCPGLDCQRIHKRLRMIPLSA